MFMKKLQTLYKIVRIQKIQKQLKKNQKKYPFFTFFENKSENYEKITIFLLAKKMTKKRQK